MQLLKLIFFGVMWTRSCPITRAMGLCEFADKSPCEDSEGIAPLHSGCRNHTTSRKHEVHQPVESYTSSEYSNPGHTSSVGNFSSLIQVITDASTTGVIATDHRSTDRVTSVHVVHNQMSTSHSTTDRVTLRLSTTEGEIILDALTDHVATGHSITDQVSSSHANFGQVATDLPASTQVASSVSTTTGVTIVNAGTDQVTTSVLISNQVTTGHSTSGKRSPHRKITSQVSTSLATSYQVTTAPTGHSIFDQVTIDNEVTENMTNKESTSDITRTSNQMTSQESISHEKIYQITTGDFPSERVTSSSLPTGGTSVDMASDRGTTAQSETTQNLVSKQSCPLNMIYAHCSTCERTCSDPNSCISNCDEAEACVCPDGYFLKQSDCVTQEECECYIEGFGVLPEGGFYVTSDCTLQCICSAGQLQCDNEYRCSSYAVCESRDNVRKCYCNSEYTGDGVTCTSTYIPTDCYDVFIGGNTGSGVYNIKPTIWSGAPFQVYCNMADGGGWTVFQRRVDGTVNFDLYWNDFKEGFGSPNFEHWLGNEKIFSLTNQKDYQLQIDFVNLYRNPYYAKYNSFRIENEANNYRLTVGIYSEGNAGDSLKVSQDNEEFSTRDQDNDNFPTGNIAAIPVYGAWWYGTDVYSSDLNADYASGNIYWKTLPGHELYIKFTEMKVRPV